MSCQIKFRNVAYNFALQFDKACQGFGEHKVN